MSPADRRQMMLAGPIVPTILTLAALNVLNVAMQSLVSISDSWFVAQLGLVDLAALALVFPAQMALGQMSAGAMGGGISSSVARALGAGNRAAAEAAAAHALVIALGMAAAFALVLVAFGRPIYGALGGSGAALDRAVAFSTVLFLGCFAHWGSNTLASVLRGTGDMKTPGYAFVAASVIQIPLTGTLTLGWFGMPKLGIVGPAASAVISFALSGLWMLSRLVGRNAALRLHWPKDGFQWRFFRDILKVGLIACLVVILTNGTVLMVTGLVGRAGDAAIAGYGIGSRLEYMMVPISFGIGAALTVMVGTSIGSRQYARARRVAWIGAFVAGGIAAAIGVTVALAPDLWLGLFTRHPGALASGRIYLPTVGPVYGFFGLAMALYFASQGTGEMIWPVMANLTRIVIAVCGSLLALDVLGWGLQGLFAFVALGIVSFAAVLAFSTTRPAWRGTTMTTGLQLRSLIKKDGVLELSLAKVEVPEPAPDQVVVKVEATPINPSDLGLLLGPADMSAATTSGSGESLKVTAKVPAQALPFLAARLDQSMPVGNEGAGTVVKTGSSDEAQALMGKTVSMVGGSMYAQYVVRKARDCQPLPQGTTAAEGASWFVNPLTALGMTETMKREGHKALVHTAAASNLGQMLIRICLEDGIGLVNIVRSPTQAKILKDIGAKHVVDSTSPTFRDDLVQALVETGATIAFDAIGGGKLAGQILTAMEIAINRTAKEYSRYGSSVHKQVYIYGGLDTGPIEIVRNFGQAWGVGGWLLTPFLQKIGRPEQTRLRERVVNSLKTTFASHYTRTISLAEVLDLKNIAVYNKRATGEKFLINPNKA